MRYDFGKLVKGLSVRMVGSVTSQNRSTTKRTKTSEVFDYTIELRISSYPFPVPPGWGLI